MKKFLIVVSILLLAAFVAIGIVIARFDIDAYRPKIIATLGDATGRMIALNGPIKMNLTLFGVTVSIQDAAIGNPAWASRPQMAGIGRFELDVAILPLIFRHLVINGLKIENADIMLESSGDHQHNWVMSFKEEAPQAAEPAGSSSSSTTPVALHVDHLSIINSQITFRDESGKATYFKTRELTLVRKEDSTDLHFSGAYNEGPITLDFTTNGDDLLSGAVRPVAFDLRFTNFDLTAKGKINIDDKKALLDFYELTAGQSKLHGSLAALWDGPKPSIVGVLNSPHLMLSDFSLVANASPSQQKGPPEPVADPARLFSDAPLDFQALNLADIKFDIAIDDLPLGKATLKQIDSKLVLENGHLFLVPVNAKLGRGELVGQFNIDAGMSPPHLGLTLNAADVNLADILQAGGLESFVSGKVNVQLNIVSNGNSLHEIASNLGGFFNLVGAGGDVMTRASDRITAGFESLLSSGSKREQNLNCLVARFVISKGLARSNGILLDTAAATVAGNGGFDLRDETIDLLFHAKPKIVDIGALFPPVHIYGTFLNPDYHVDATAVIGNVTNMLTGDSAADAIPDVVIEQGQNACVAALDHPAAAGTQSSSVGVVQQLGGKAKEFLKGLLGQ